MVLLDILTDARWRFAHHPALVMRVGYRTVTLTYEQVFELSQQTAAFLAAKGIGKGDCVAVCAPNSPYWGCLFWGCMMRGAVIVPLNVQSTPDMIAKIIKQTEAKVFFNSQIGGPLREVQEGTDCLLINPRRSPLENPLGSITTFPLALLDELVAPYAGQPVEIVQIAPDDLMEILYTSGTTGEPKGVMLTHTNLMINVRAVETLFHFNPMQERVLSILPLSHILEQTDGFLLPFTCGATIVYAHSPTAIAPLLCDFRITKMVAVPEFLKVLMARIMAKVHEAGREAAVIRLMAFSQWLPWWWVRRLLFRPILKQLGGSLTVVASGGAPLDPELERQWNAMGVQVLQGYGLTETSPVVTSNMFTDHRPGSVGRVVPGVSLRLARDGEIRVKGDSVFSGYFKNEQKTREVFTADGWFMTGDMGELDADGFLFIKGRKKYMIKGAGAQNVYPEDIEEALNRESAVKDSCVVGVEHPGGAVQIHAVLLLREALSADEVEALVTMVNARLATYQHIGGWTVWPEDDFPRSATRKIKKEDVKAFLKTRAGQGPAGEPTTASKLVALVAQVAGVSVSTIAPTTVLVRQLHLDSLMTVELLARIEEAFTVAVEGWIIGPTTTVADVQAWIDKGAPATKPVRLKAWPRSWWARLVRALGQPLVAGLTRLLVKVKVEGLENLQGDGLRSALGRGGRERPANIPNNSLNNPIILMPNHVSMLDSFFLTAALPPKLRRRIAFAAAQDFLYKEYRWLAPLAELFYYAFPFPRKEHENIAQGLVLMGQVLEHGYSVVVFPEGQISLDGQLQPLKQGAGLIASQMMATVVPVALIGVQSVVGPEGLFPKHRGTVTVRFGQPVTVSRAMSIAQATCHVEAALHSVIDKG